MSFEERTLSEKDLISLFAIEENHFNDFNTKILKERSWVEQYLHLQMQVEVMSI